ncbi:hypothetical protein [Microbacterium luticocti]|uniref:hypothetical protein n=1 Tax=Microbacterium luticocti TaxID=451764 RepID=UPI0012EC66E5|nr:hypothetical protein [Microbacterium luticocti]
MVYRDFVYFDSDGSVTTLGDGVLGYEGTLRNIVLKIGSAHRSWMTFARVPEGIFPDQAGTSWSPTVFLQAAGTAEAMTVEWRKLGDDGKVRLYTLGRGGPRDDEPTIPIHFNDGEAVTYVYPDEVYDATEAGDIFVDYYHHETLTDHYALRVHTDVV